ncbi:hypothetical protein QBC32DRAFT_344239 [Pseudoneurospora amorphoporcata]|uniref:Secreted protein n=1 Tax=Pseudoneurospora amorphoporcata TaxID=241081 RepID=A0AAN6SFL0_9PEZI|nr:hypothetical protein QBC32DRAFT_344239 [Pseudoneurospora amorphoporcata]
MKLSPTPVCAIFLVFSPSSSSISLPSITTHHPQIPNILSIGSHAEPPTPVNLSVDNYRFVLAVPTPPVPVPIVHWRWRRYWGPQISR